MHCNDEMLPNQYKSYLVYKRLVFVGCLIALGVVLVISVSLGAANIGLWDVLDTLVSPLVKQSTAGRTQIIIWNIRLPQALAAMVAGAGLAISGAVMQSILRNPLGSPFTLGISHAAAFGAALSVMVFGTGTMTSSHVGAIQLLNPIATTLSAFSMSLGAALVIVSVSRIRGASPETMILTGVALGALFTASTMFLQFFADDVQLAAMVFWTFGDTARASWNELGLLAAITIPVSFFFLCNSWSYNAIDAGDETAASLGVSVERTRLIGMLLASLLTATLIAMLGIIGFVGLVVPHIVRRVIGADHRYLLPVCFVSGALLLLVSDTVARLILAPHVLPVSVLTAFMGAPVFLWLIIRGRQAGGSNG